jgi:hypothetical protein
MVAWCLLAVAPALNRDGSPHSTKLPSTASEGDAVSILADNLPVAKGTVVANGNRIAVNELLRRPPDMR